jgi:Flp pilus assembly protein protease CpaA
MISPQVGKVIFRITFYITVVSAVLVWFTEKNSAEFVVATITLIVGLMSSVVLFVIVRRESK